MSGKKRRTKEEDVNYWQSISDVMAALLLVVLLLMMLFILQLTRVEDTDFDDYEPYDDGGGAYSTRWTPTPEPVRYEPVREEHDAGGGGGGGSGGFESGRGDGEGDWEYAQPGEGDWQGQEKAAVYVTVKDGETGLSIKEAGIGFELIRYGKGRQTLCTYYPKKEKFESFETTAAGSFYLPEKIALGNYHFTELSVPYGYDPAEDAKMFIEEAHDWDEPYTVEIFLWPCRNVIRIENTDAETGETVAGGEYEIIAAADIVTADGTMRCKEGEVADRVVIGGDGTGESCELYLGPYLLRQVKSAEHYARENADTKVQVERKKPDTEEPVTSLPQTRTRLTLTLTDALYTEEGISDAEFVLSGGGETRRLRTDAIGQIILEGLKKDTAYTLRQTAAAAGYTEKTEPVRFTVSADGTIDGEAQAEMTAVCRKTRITVSVTDSVFKNSMSGTGVALYDENGETVKLWTTSAVPEELENLAPGSYHLQVNGKTVPIEVRETEEIQRFAATAWSTAGILSVSGAGALLVTAAVMLLKRLKKIRRKRGGKA